MAEYEFHYSHFPALASYINRIGAEQINFKKFSVREQNGHYYTELAWVRINDDRTIRVQQTKRRTPRKMRRRRSSRNSPRSSSPRASE